VRSYRTISPLPRALAGRSAVCFLLHFPSARAAQALPGTVPCGARTFLGILSDDATAWPTPPGPLSHVARPEAATPDCPGSPPPARGGCSCGCVPLPLPLPLPLILIWLSTFGAPPKRRRRRTRPRRAPHMDVRRFPRGQDAPSENPAGSADPVQRTGREGGVCFLCARFLCTSKERWLAPSRRESS